MTRKSSTRRGERDRMIPTENDRHCPGVQHVAMQTDDIVRTVDDGRAVVANIAGTATDTDGTTHSFEGGHYISVVGYRDNGETVTIADSADPAQASYRMNIDTLADWIATRLR